MHGWSVAYFRVIRKGKFTVRFARNMAIGLGLITLVNLAGIGVVAITGEWRLVDLFKLPVTLFGLALFRVFLFKYLQASDEAKRREWIDRMQSEWMR